MSGKISRRRFVISGAAAGIGAGLGVAMPEKLKAGAPAVLRGGRVRPVVIASANGHRYRHDGDKTCVETVFSMMTGDSDVLDAVIAGVTLNELDPGDASVGYGGLPNGDGVVQLDASVMHGPNKRAGSVAALEGVRTPSHVAQAVMDLTDHILLVGSDAQNFARQLGFTIEDDLNSENSRRRWLDWKRRVDPSRWLDPRTRSEAAHEAGLQMMAEGLIDPEDYWGTINCNAVNPRGEVAGCTTTSGLAWKIPGRVGDSPIIGAGLYVDNDVGAAGSTGRGEANLYNLSSYLIVENMRRGMTPKDAGMAALERVKQNTVESRLLHDDGLPAVRLRFYIINGQGDYAGVSMYQGASFSVCTEDGPAILDCEGLLDREE